MTKIIEDAKLNELANRVYKMWGEQTDEKLHNISLLQTSTDGMIDMWEVQNAFIKGLKAAVHNEIFEITINIGDMKYVYYIARTASDIRAILNSIG